MSIGRLAEIARLVPLYISLSGTPPPPQSVDPDTTFQLTSTSKEYLTLTPPAIRSGAVVIDTSMAGMERGALTACSNSKRKAAEAALDDGLSDVENDVAVGADAAASSTQIEVAQKQQAPAPRQPPTKAIMSQAWIDSILADEIKPLPLNEELLRDPPKLAAIFQSHEQSRASFAEYQNAIRRELETKGFVEVDDDYDEICELLHAVSTAAFYGREEDEKEAMAKLAALRRR
ncbi:hypothetical protein BDA96_05G201400 [Sorghum bicolor]|uniref:Uncharacterized protein n=2 Tax=Sorghum bicolor TaxID=4558 RepID=A0A921QYC3_SORBI|nr:hypothetical protein BDA96_05G201400 [Sorghum bicolor]KXG28926.1 hypothetical protein SORBI_3005G185100 [Sorghum bicolor]